MKYFLTLGFLLSFFITNAQFLGGDVTAGYKSSGIFDTVNAVIVIDNKQTKKIDRVEGYAIREWQTWYGGIDPYFSYGYKPSPDQWVVTGKFLYKNKKKISSKIWQYEVSANEFKPVPKVKEGIEKGIKLKNRSLIPSKGLEFNSDSLSLIFDSVTTRRCVPNHIDTCSSYSFPSLIPPMGFAYGFELDSIIEIQEMGRKTKLNKYFNYFSSEKAMFYVDVSKTNHHKAKIRKYKGYRILKLYNKNIDYEFVDENNHHFNSRLVYYEIYNW